MAWPRRPSRPKARSNASGTIAADVFAHRSLADLIAACQPVYDAFPAVYNHERPHAALDFAVPISRYAPSRRPFPDPLPDIAYGPDDQVRLVRDQGAIGFRNRSWFISRGLIGRPVAVRPTSTDGVFQVVFCQQQVATLDLRRGPEV